MARISYGNSVLVSCVLCPSVTTRYRLEPRWDRDFWFPPYDSLEFLVFRDKISWFMPLGEGGSHEREGERRAPP